MAIFISTLAYHTPAAVDIAKLAVLLGSGMAALMGAAILWFANNSSEEQAATEVVAAADLPLR